MPNEISYMREQFNMLVPNKNGYISMQNFKAVSFFLFFFFFRNSFFGISIPGDPTILIFRRL